MVRQSLKCAALTLICTLPLGCNFFVTPGGEETNKSELKAFNSEGEFVSYMRGQITQRNELLSGMSRDEDGAMEDSAGGEGGAPPTAAPGDPNLSSDADDAGNHSGTTTQEQGVDEADVVKTDGRHLYVISTRNEGSVLRIVQIGAGGQTTLLSETEIDGYGRDLYLHGNTVVALTTGGGFVYPVFSDGIGGVEPGSAGEPAVAEGKDAETEADAISTDIGLLPLEDYVYERPNTRSVVIDVSNPASPQVLSSTKIDGSVASSRMVNGVMHLVLANYQDYYYDVLPRLGAPELDVSDVDAELVLPKYTRTNADGTTESGTVVTWENLYRPADPDGFGIVTVVNMDIDDDAKFVAVGVVAEPGLIYASTEALYLTDTNYFWDGSESWDRTNTDIYKFQYQGRGAVPVAFGTVPGRILNQYSMGEHNGNLRVATTFDPTWRIDEAGFGGQITESSNNVYVLKQSGSELGIAGRIENLAVGESIQSARFLGDRGFVVTFRQIDPLFTIDLADPENPKVLGELKVPGFSTFLTPIDANHLLGVGQYIPPPETPGNWGVQLSIFDVSDLSAPTLKSNVIIGADANTSAYSEALWDPKALTYYAEGGVLALPMSIYEWTHWGGGVVEGDVDVDAGGGSSGSSTGSAGTTDGADAPPPDDVDVSEPDDDIIAPQEPQGFEGIYVFSVSAESGFTELGKVSTRFEDSQWWGASYTRGVFVGDDLYAVTDLGVHSASLSDLATEQSQLFFGLPYDIDESPVPVDPPVVDGDLPVDDSDPDDGTVTDPAEPVLGSEVTPN